MSTHFSTKTAHCCDLQVRIRFSPDSDSCSRAATASFSQELHHSGGGSPVSVPITCLPGNLRVREFGGLFKPIASAVPPALAEHR